MDRPLKLTTKPKTLSQTTVQARMNMAQDFETALSSIDHVVTTSVLKGCHQLPAIPVGWPCGNENEWSDTERSRADRIEQEYHSQVDAICRQVAKNVREAIFRDILLAPKVVGHYAKAAISRARSKQGAHASRSRKQKKGGRQAIRWISHVKDFVKRNRHTDTETVIARLVANEFIDHADDQVTILDASDDGDITIPTAQFRSRVSSIISKEKRQQLKPKNQQVR
jgi:hypothetical protein